METRTDTETLAQLGGLASFLSSRRQAILDAWRSAVLEDPELKTASKVSVLHFEDSIPRMLESFERMLATSSDRSSSPREEGKAHEHGAHRWLEGYSLRELVHEWGHLQICVMDELDRYAEARYDRRLPGVLRFARRLWLKFSGEAISNSVEQFTRLQRAEAEAVYQDLQHAVTKLRDTDRQRTEIWREAAHDLRGNVGLVTTTAAILTEDGLPDGLRVKAFTLLQANVTSLTSLLDDLLGLARLEAGREDLHLQTFDAAALLRNLCSTLEPSATKKGLYLRTEGPLSLVVEGDPAKTQRILQNLTLNALKYTESGGIVVSWKPTQEKDVERWAIRIQDTGPGYEPGGPLSKELQKATESSLAAEERGGSSSVEPVPSLPGSSPPPPGTPLQRPGEGIGLLIVKRLCELLQASMEIASAPGEGTIFQIVLPRSYARPPR
jgi:signal transduction histidine kinase